MYEHDTAPDLQPSFAAPAVPPPHERQRGGLAAVWFFVWDFLKIFLLALAIIIPVRFYLFQPFIVTGNSMLPNFHQGEYLIIDEISYRLTAPKRGEVVVIRAPKFRPTDENQFFIKRLIGLPGETIDIKEGRVKITNPEHPEGTVLLENYLPSSVTTFGAIHIVLGNNQFYVLGDNRTASSDSRQFGPIDREKIVGRVLLRAFPLDTFTTFSQPRYQN